MQRHHKVYLIKKNIHLITEHKTMKKLQFHQGDVQGKSISKIPANAKKIVNTPLAYGELSGHIHILTGDVSLYEEENTRYALVGSEGARLQHTYESMVDDKSLISIKEISVADHHSILLPKGIYEFGIHKRYNPFSKIFERVVD